MASEDPIANASEIHSEIKKVAYNLWELAARPSGFDLTFWLQAERQVKNGRREPVPTERVLPPRKTRTDRRRAAASRESAK
jgi:hypothetical protein